MKEIKIMIREAYNIKHNTGMALVEIVVGLAIISISLISLLSNYRAHLKAVSANIESIKATYLAEETLEVVRFLRDSSWTKNIANLSDDTDYYIYWDGNVWVSTTTPQLIDDFSRSFKLSSVNGDENVKKVDVTVDTKTFSTYITNLFKN